MQVHGMVRRKSDKYLCQIPFVLLPKSLSDEGEFGTSGIFKSRIFIIFLFLMVCSGASEMGMGQWSSLFAEIGLGVSKEVGDILGPCFFAVLMGLSRVLYTLFGKKISARRGSNPRPPPWQGGAPPLSHSRVWHVCRMSFGQIIMYYKEGKKSIEKVYFFLGNSGKLCIQLK